MFLLSDMSIVRSFFRECLSGFTKLFVEYSKSEKWINCEIENNNAKQQVRSAVESNNVIVFWLGELTIRIWGNWALNRSLWVSILCEIHMLEVISELYDKLREITNNLLPTYGSTKA